MISDLLTNTTTDEATERLSGKEIEVAEHEYENARLRYISSE